MDVASSSTYGNLICYEIRNPDGSLWATHKRKDYPDGSKKVWWEPRGVSTKEAPLYGCERLAEGDGKTVMVVEGEKAADALARALGDKVHMVGTVCGADAPPSPPFWRRLQTARWCSGRTTTSRAAAK